jgi:hypothetical protein
MGCGASYSPSTLKAIAIIPKAPAAYLQLAIGTNNRDEIPSRVSRCGSDPAPPEWQAIYGVAREGRDQPRRYDIYRRIAEPRRDVLLRVGRLGITWLGNLHHQHFCEPPRGMLGTNAMVPGHTPCISSFGEPV